MFSRFVQGQDESRSIGVEERMAIDDAWKVLRYVLLVILHPYRPALGRPLTPSGPCDPKAGAAVALLWGKFSFCIPGPRGRVP